MVNGLGDRVRDTREKLGLSILQVAQACGLSDSTVLRVERGEVDPSVGTVEAIARVLGVTTCYLVGEGPAPDEPLKPVRRGRPPKPK